MEPPRRPPFGFLNFFPRFILLPFLAYLLSDLFIFNEKQNKFSEYGFDWIANHVLLDLTTSRLLVGMPTLKQLGNSTFNSLCLVLISCVNLLPIPSSHDEE